MTLVPGNRLLDQPQFQPASQGLGVLSQRAERGLVATGAGFQPGNRGLRGSDSLRHLRLSQSSRGARTQKLIEDGELLFQPIVFGPDFRSGERSRLE